jgi:hypothetical protein
MAAIVSPEMLCAYVVWKMIDPAKLFYDDRLDLGFQLWLEVG